MDPPLALDGWLKRTTWMPPVRSLVGAQHCYGNQQEAEYNRPGGDSVRPWTHSLRNWKSRASTRVARRGSESLDEHQALTGPDFPHAATHRGNGFSPGVGRHSPLVSSAAFDPFAHILYVGPPNTGLGSSWHRGDANSAPGGPGPL
jgi:hypothetical protein